MAFIVAACAKPMTPEGGPKDVTPPRILSSVPDTFSLNFNSKTIFLEFDEYVSIKSPGNEIFSSPPFKNKPDFKIKPKSLTVIINDTLIENTTYTINFGYAITDNNEGNVLKNFQYIFSTGDYIDSLRISGTINDAFTGKPLEKAKVMLYIENIDSLPLTVKPYYYGMTDESGNFRISYLKAGDFKIFALKDENDNFLYDIKTEAIAFQEETVNTLDSNLFVRMRSFVGEDTIASIKKIESPYYGLIRAKFTKAISEDSLVFQSDFNYVRADWNVDRDSVIIWYNDYQSDTLKVTLLNGGNSDSKVLRIRTKRDYSKPLRASGGGRGGAASAADVDDLKLKLNYFQGNKVHFFESVKIMLNRPIGSLDTNKVLLFELDSISLKPQLHYNEFDMEISILNSFLPEKDYRIVLNDSSIVDFLGASHDSIAFVFRLSAERDYGNAEVTFKTDVKLPQIILELVNDKNVVISKNVFPENSAYPKLVFKNLIPGVYRMRMILDENENGKWDTGNYFRKIQPEKVILMSETINVRQGWDVSLEWNYSENSENSAEPHRTGSPKR